MAVDDAEADTDPPARPTTVVVAPDAFKGTLAAHAVADALARGLARAGWHDVDRCPVADGGEGTRDVLVGALGGHVEPVTVRGPLGAPVEAGLGMLEDGETAVVEVAAASGLGLLAPDARDAEAASSAGTGELIAAAVERGARRVLVAAGGSATTDGGAGALAAIEDASPLDRARLVVLCDTRTPFERAAQVFAPQKGAAPDTVARLRRRLDELADRGLPRDPRGRPYGGAAGGLAGGLWAAHRAELVSGAGFVLDALGFEARMRSARAVVVGEGRLDAQTLTGKAAGEIAVRCRQAGVPAHAVVGTRALDDFGARVLDLQTVQEAGTPDQLEAAGERLVASL